MERLRELPKQLLALWRSMTPRARILASALSVAVLVATLWIATAANHIDYGPLYGRLDQSDAGAVSEKLRELRVPFRVSGQDTIEVPRERVAEVRLQLAAAGLPQGGALGFELFDRQSFGASEHTQRVNYQRALQGELERSIGTLTAVRRARVHLVVPERTLFAPPVDQQQPSAAVLLQLHGGRQLAPEQVQAVVHLVASSVAGLSPERVTVVDSNHRLLSQQGGAHDGQSAALSYQREVEKMLSQRAQELLERTVGKGRAAVQVTAQVDAAQVVRTHEEFNPDQQVLRSEQEVQDVVGATAEASGGVAGARGNLPGGPPPQQGPAEGSKRTSSTRNYEISKVVRKVTEPVGRLQRLTVAVMVDGAPDPAAQKGRGEGQAATRGFAARSKEELLAYEGIVKEAVGFDARRGDQIVVQSLPFVVEVEEALAPAWPLALLPRWAYAALGVTLLALLALAVRALRRQRPLEAELVPSGVQLPSSVQQLEDQLRPRPQLTQGAADEALRVRQQVLELIASEPERAVRVLRGWLNEPHDEDAQKALVPATQGASAERRNRAHRA